MGTLEKDLENAVSKENLKEVQKLLQAGVNPAADDNALIKKHVLLGTLSSKKVQIIIMLLNAGASLPDEYFEEMAERGYTQIVKVLLEKGARYNQYLMNSAAIAAARGNYPDTVILLLKAGAILRGEKIFWAIENNYTKILSILLRKGVEIPESDVTKHFLKWASPETWMCLLGNEKFFTWVKNEKMNEKNILLIEEKKELTKRLFNFVNENVAYEIASFLPPSYHPRCGVCGGKYPKSQPPTQAPMPATNRITESCSVT